MKRIIGEAGGPDVLTRGKVAVFMVWFASLCALGCDSHESPTPSDTEAKCDLLGDAKCDSGPADHLDTPAACNPFGDAKCMLPWPSSIYTKDDPSSATGLRLAIPPGVLPTNASGVAIDPAPYSKMDGFSATAPIVTAFAIGVDGSNLVSHLDFPASVTDASPTVLVDMDSGKRVVHFAELDEQADGPTLQALYIRPAARLHGARRYAVAIRKSLRARAGGELPMPEGFRAIVDGTPTDHALTERVRARYAKTLAALEAAGVPREDMLVAWDFTTASDESVRRDVLAARDRTIAQVGDRGKNLSFEVLSDLPQDGEPLVRRRISGTFDTPLFLTEGGDYGPTVKLKRDPSTGLPTSTGMYRVPFWSLVPECVYEAKAPVPVLMYFHGFLGTGEQATGKDVIDAALHICAVVVGTDMRGLSRPDLGSVIAGWSDLNNVGVFEQQVQGLVNHFALQFIARGPMTDKLWVDSAGTSLVDPEKLYIYGISQGHMYASSVMAYDPFVTRAVLSSGGANLALMQERSAGWGTFKTMLAGAYGDSLNQALVVSLAQMHWDATEAAGSANGLLTGEIPGTPKKHVLMLMNHADESVSNLSTAWQARTMGLSQLGPAPYDIYGLPTKTGPLSDGLVVYHGGAANIPIGNIAPEDTRSHYIARAQPASWRQMAHFYATGEITQQCEGACMCAKSACE